MRVRLLSLVTAIALGTMLSVIAAPVTGAPSPAAKARFIVTLVDGADPRDVAADYRGKGADVDYVYTTALNGFAGAMSDGHLRSLAGDRRVARVERDGVAYASEEVTQSNATWGLDRIDQTTGTNGAYTYDHTGIGVRAYIVDTGIRFSHAEFAGRASEGFDAFGGTGADCNGHGTHVAGTVGGTTWGVAKQVELVAVRVLDCSGSGSWSGIIAGLDWITRNAIKPAVANMSLGGGASVSVDDAVDSTIEAGVPVVVAAGNGNKAGRAQDACGYSPARVPAAITIGATNSSDAKTSWSNYGSCVDFFAPGASITSAWHSGDAVTNTISGTSMAAPHVAGVAALYLQQDANALPTVVGAALEAAATKGVVTSSNTANNHLLYSFVTPGQVSPPPPADTEAATITLTLTKGAKAKNVTTVTAVWEDSAGISDHSYDVWANGAVRARNITGDTYEMNWRGSGTVTYRVCRAGGTSTCSAYESITV